jgi:hypothetical protein
MSRDFFRCPDKPRPLEFSVNAPPRWLELALAVDHTVIRFHGRERVHQYILALMNIVSTTGCFIMYHQGLYYLSHNPPPPHKYELSLINIVNTEMIPTGFTQLVLGCMFSPKGTSYL